MMLMPKGTLGIRARQQKLLSELTLYADAEHEEFAEVQVITLQQRAKDLAFEQIMREVNVDIEPQQKVQQRVAELAQSEYAPSLREFVLIQQDKIRIGIDRDQIDDRAIDYALTLLLHVDSYNPGDLFEFEGGELVQQ